MNSVTHTAAIDEAVTHLRNAAEAKKCWTCGCLHNTVRSITSALPASARTPDLEAALQDAHGRMGEVRQDCLGCAVCYPALATNTLNQLGSELTPGLDACPAEAMAEREGWPPLPGSYTVVRYQAPVAVCTLSDDTVAAEILRRGDAGLALVGALQTENLGIERLITNVLANPNIRFLVVCGSDSRQAVGHLPGQSLVALARSGLDEHSRIMGAMGKRPVIRNLSGEVVDHFRRTVEVVDLVGTEDVSAILQVVRACADRSPGPATPFTRDRVVLPTKGHIPDRMVSDPAGYFIVYVDRSRGVLTLEHCHNTGVLSSIIAGHVASELYIPAVEKGLVSRLDHAAYLGRELALAERALQTGEDYVQDAAPEAQEPAIGTGCGCGSSCC